MVLGDKRLCAALILPSDLWEMAKKSEGVMEDGNVSDEKMDSIHLVGSFFFAEEYRVMFMQKNRRYRMNRKYWTRQKVRLLPARMRIRVKS